MKRQPFEVETITLPDEEGCLFPSGGVRAHRYHPANPGARAAAGVVILPIQGGDYDVSTHFAEMLAKAGFRAMRFERRAEWLDPEREIDDLVLLTRQWVRDVQHGIEGWLAEPEGGPERVGLLGVSMGAIVGTIVAATTPRVECTMLAIGGGGIADIVMRGNDEELNAYRVDLARRLGLPEPELRPIFERAFAPHDNLSFAPQIDAARTLMVAARFDRVVSFEANTRLWEAIGRPRRHTLPCGHYSTALFLPLVDRWCRRFFDEQLTGG